MVKIFLPLALAGLVAATPLSKRQNTPTVTIKNGTVRGTSSGDIESFSGIPYAQQPVGNLRLRPPQPLKEGFPGGSFDASHPAGACPQFAFQVDKLADSVQGIPNDVFNALIGEVFQGPLGQIAENQTESCLTVTIQRPAGTTKDSKLPVLFWIFGGGFEMGSTSQYDAANFVKQSAKLGKPIVFVAVNYRVNGYGFLAGKELAAEHSTNIGLRDQRLGLKWVQDNIEAFGGDRSKVTIWGESAGAISVCDQTILDGGNLQYNGGKLFRGAIMNSGSIIPSQPVTSRKAQAIFDQVVAAAGCDEDSDKLSCLRSLSPDSFHRAVTTVPGIFSHKSLDLSYLPRPDPGDSFYPQSPEVLIQSGRVAKVPVIIGDQEDEGTLFALVQSDIHSNQDLVNYLASYFEGGNPGAQQDVADFLEFYPDWALLGQPDGSPFGTANFNNIYPQFKRLAAVLGDLTFTLTRRCYLRLIAQQGIPAYSYLSTLGYGIPFVGTFHFSDMILAWLPASSSTPSKTFQNYYISFIYTGDPNKLGITNPLIEWPKWTNESLDMINMGATSNTLMTDDFRAGAGQFLANKTSHFRV